VGLGILFLAGQFWETGIVAMGLIMIGSLFLSLYCTSLILECSTEHGDSYSDIAVAAYGPKMKILTEILIIASQMSFCVNYCYFITSQMGSVINCSYADADPITCNKPIFVKEQVTLWYFLPILMLIYVPLVWIRSMEKLAFTHVISDILILTVVTAIFIFGGINIADQGKVTVNPLVTPLFYKAIPYSAFAFEGVAVVIPLR
jgi:amino acid permease